MKRLTYKTLISEIQELTGAGRLVLPLLQVGSVPLEACVEVGDKVERGQCIGKAQTPEVASLHSPLAGRVSGLFPSVSLEGTSVPSVEIEGDATGGLRSLDPIGQDTAELPAETLQDRLREAGVSPLGGNGKNAAYVSLRPNDEAPETLLVLCADDEPLLQTQRHILQDRPEKVIEGATLFQKAVGARRLVFAVTPNQQNLVSGETVLVEKKYPSGHPEILMARVTGRYGLDEGRPRKDVYVISAETAMAVCRAVREGLPVIDKVVTVGQEGAMPVVVRVPLGAPFSQVLEKTGLTAEDGDRLFTGGPLRGVAHFDPEGPITKGTDGLFLQKGEQVFCYEDVACIGCGQCVKVCPMKIPVNMMTRNCEFARIEEALAYDLGSCIECGLCAYVCTARRPLLQYIQFAKKEHEKAERERQSA
jgi:electron transport complex protein RnfC